MTRGGKGEDDPVRVKKYANRRLYNTATSRYVTLDDLAEMVRDGVDFMVVDAKTEADITRSVLAQIIFDQEAKGEAMLPLNFLRELIRLYGDNLQAVVPNYLDMSMNALLRQQEKFRDGVTGALGRGSLDIFEEQAKRNVEIFDQTLKMFTGARSGAGGKPATRETSEAGRDDEISEIKAQLKALQDRLSKIGD